MAPYKDTGFCSSDLVIRSPWFRTVAAWPHTAFFMPFWHPEVESKNPHLPLGMSATAVSLPKGQAMFMVAAVQHRPTVATPSIQRRQRNRSTHINANSKFRPCQVNLRINESANSLPQVLAMTALCVGTASLVAEITTADSEAAIRAALAFSILGVISNLLTSVLLELRGRRTGGHPSQRLQGWVVGSGALWPVLASMCLFVRTQPVAIVVATGAVGGLVVFGLVAVFWFEQPV